jgi:photosystem II stability/assembly factor-like uncharacterized protein
MNAVKRAVQYCSLLGAASLMVACPPNTLLDTIEAQTNAAQGGGPPVAIPVLIPSAGTYSSNQSVSITDSTPGALIHYTTDGSTPTVSTALYTGPIPVVGNGTALTIKAVGTERGMTDSPLATDAYAINYSQVSTPQLSLVGGTYTTDQSIAITDSTSGSPTIYYTTDGSNPTTSSNVYTLAIPVTGPNTTETIKALAVKTGMADSTVASVTYTILYQYMLTVNAASGGSTSPSGTQAVNHGAATSITATPNTNYVFVNWTVTSGTGVSFGSAGSASTTVTLTSGPATIQANFFKSVFTWTDQTLAGTRTWITIASSSDGAKLAAAVQNADIWTSTDSGAHWTDQTLAGSRNWNTIASSSDGTKLAAVVYNGGDIWTSTDSGVHWTDQTLAGTRNWNTIASSSDGTKLAAAVYGGDVWTSTDSGVHWTDQTLSGSRSWYAIASSSDGAKLAAGSGVGDIFTSTDGGAHWTDQTLAGSRWWVTIASSSDGVNLAAGEYNGDIWTSSDSGAHWTDRTLAGTRKWNSIASSSDGTKLAADVQLGDIWTSMDGGVHWTDQTLAGTRGWSRISCSSDGTKLAATVSGGDIFTGQ